MANQPLKWRRGRGGVTIVEVALTLPLLLLLVFGVTEYSWAFLRAGELNNAAREGARYAISPDVTSVGQLTSSSSPMVLSLQQSKIKLADVSVQVPTGLTPGRGNPVEITLSVPYSKVKLLGLPFVHGTETLHASVRMMKEGP